MIERHQIIDDVERVLEVSVSRIYVEKIKSNEDIVNYLRASIQKSKLLKTMKKNSQNEIVETIAEKANEMFMWIKLMMQELSQKTRVSNIWKSLRRALKNLKKMLQHVLKEYSFMLKEESSNDLNIMLMWVTCVTRSLFLEELNIILRLQSSAEDEVLFLKHKLRKQLASFFVLTRQDHLFIADLDAGNPKIEYANDEEDKKNLDDVKNETTFSQISRAQL